MDDLIGEAFLYIFGPVVAIVLVVGGIGGMIGSCSKKDNPNVQIQKIEQKESLSFRAGNKAKDAGKDFIRGFFAK